MGTLFLLSLLRNLILRRAFGIRFGNHRVKREVLLRQSQSDC
ncbi:hypothetical protein ALP8811_02724 [Aliiroseovarius pelagivivens]|uniref:Uncharacterized protein n=1 Tax=Aliiroseovarius pelagivivens TaxID=1639690 RepID=A0A2R8ARV7_9RHOB|nr:hypothetical protein ALP8811_02724 [Aliiroseovarius pelagivivens]